jgi:hypothetical protein
LALNGPLQKKDGRYLHTPSSAAFLDPISPACLAPIARFMPSAALRGPDEQLAEVVRKGTTLLPGNGTLEPENPAWAVFAESMAPMMALGRAIGRSRATGK